MITLNTFYKVIPSLMSPQWLYRLVEYWEMHSPASEHSCPSASDTWQQSTSHPPSSAEDTPDQTLRCPGGWKYYKLTMKAPSRPTLPLQYQTLSIQLWMTVVAAAPPCCPWCSCSCRWCTPPALGCSAVTVTTSYCQTSGHTAQLSLLSQYTGTHCDNKQSQICTHQVLMSPFTKYGMVSFSINKCR